MNQQKIKFYFMKINKWLLQKKNISEQLYFINNGIIFNLILIIKMYIFLCIH